MRVKLKKIPGNLVIFNRKERVNYEIYEKKGKVCIKLIYQIGKSES